MVHPMPLSKGTRRNPNRAIAGRIDISHDGQHPTLILETNDGTWIERRLTPTEQAAIIRLLAGTLQRHIRGQGDADA
jgi:hypothetical protein